MILVCDGCGKVNNCVIDLGTLYWAYGGAEAVLSLYEDEILLEPGEGWEDIFDDVQKSDAKLKKLTEYIINTNCELQCKICGLVVEITNEKE